MAERAVSVFAGHFTISVLSLFPETFISQSLLESMITK